MKTKKKVAFMVSNLCTKGGTERVTSVLSKQLSQYYDCSIITQWHNGNYAYEMPEEVKIFNVSDSKKRLRYSFIECVKNMSNYINVNKINVLIVVGRNNNIIPFALKLLTKCKIIFCEHSTINKKFKNKKYSFKERMYSKFFDWSIVNFSEKIVVLTEKEANNYINILNINKSEIEIIPNIYVSNVYNNEYDIKSKIICTVGRIENEKGIDLLLKVARDVFKINEDWKWHLYGNGNFDYIHKLELQIEKFKLCKHFLLKGNVDDVDKVMKKSSFFVFGSRFEGFGLVLLEAKANKLPLISFDIYSGPSDIIRDGVDGYLIKPFDTDAMATKICELIENKELRQRLSDNACGNLYKFDKDVIIKKWCKLIDSI